MDVADARTLHAASFGADTQAYERGRPSYPSEALDWLLPDGARTILDLGAGTGKLTRALVARGFEVLAVDPSEGMRGRTRACAARGHGPPGFGRAHPARRRLGRRRAGRPSLALGRPDQGRAGGGTRVEAWRTFGASVEPPRRNGRVAARPRQPPAAPRFHGGPQRRSSRRASLRPHRAARRRLVEPDLARGADRPRGVTQLCPRPAGARAANDADGGAPSDRDRPVAGRPARDRDALCDALFANEPRIVSGATGWWSARRGPFQ